MHLGKCEVKVQLLMYLAMYVYVCLRCTSYPSLSPHFSNDSLCVRWGWLCEHHLPLVASLAMISNDADAAATSVAADDDDDGYGVD